ncbi:MAG: FAD-dependent oxidoreductase [Gemmatimonadetes bacterium]|nr:FAD-dependent oxidoreductase [Gemmatimonadota bacterium]
MDQGRIDVLIAGGGPGGCAAAMTLRAHAPGLSVVLAEASEYAGPRIGETLSPAAGRVLDHLGVWEAFRAQGHREAYATAAAWGSPVPYDNDFLFAARGTGWHLDRAAFDALLAREAEARGVTVLRGARVRDARREDGGWRVALAPGGELRARFLVDATGARASLARRCGARSRAVDRLAGFVRFFRDGGGSDPRTLVEAFADGWWYTAPLPGGGRVAACMTDSDLGRGLGAAEPDGWERLLASAPRVGDALHGAGADGSVVVRAARSRRLEPAAGEGWLAVGDAASTFDPLSSQGVLKALRSGTFAAYAAGDLLAKGDPAGMERYHSFVADEFAGYLRIRARYYAEESRWPERPFWRRRRTPVPA